jgi:histidinol-phosphate/aromatic aminotransferase/cobyric acid decarboxylase-like protein
LVPPTPAVEGRYTATKTSSQVWDKDAQQFHGGQDWAHLPNFLEDFSVTTNALGTPRRALERARAAVDSIHHYPPADFEPAISDLAAWLWRHRAPTAAATGRSRLLLGNGASELIDLVIRDHQPPSGGERLWKPGAPNGTQYKEYERSAQAAGYRVVAHDHRHASVTCFVNPNNPTGAYQRVEALKRSIEEQCAPGSHVIVDESMQPWVGPNWRNDSLLSQGEWIADLLESQGTHVFIMHSWTKIWSCTGVRLGSVVAPNETSLLRIKQRQVPWSVNTMALEFLSEVVKDEEYMVQTWQLTPKWRQETIDAIRASFPSWVVHGEPFLSWIWVDVGRESIAEEAVQLARQAGTPVRSGAPGYRLPTMVRIAVREPKHLHHLLTAWKPLQR